MNTCTSQIDFNQFMSAKRRKSASNVNNIAPKYEKSNDLSDDILSDNFSDEVNAASQSICQSFETLKNNGLISQGTLNFTKSMGYTRLSPVQDLVIPQLIQKRQDIAVEACTGSGKTLSFLIPCVEILMRLEAEKAQCSIGGLCLAPTRELAQQIDSVLRSYLTHINKERLIFSNVLLTGGQDLTEIKILLKKADESDENPLQNIGSWILLTATPGRLSAFIGEGYAKYFKNLDILIFDEADRLFVSNASFEQQLITILSALPKQRRMTAVFSATLSADMKSLIKAGMRSPLYIKVRVGNQESTLNESDHVIHSTPGKLKNYFALLRRQDKFPFLLQFLLSEVLRKKKRTKSIIFCLTCASVSYFYSVLTQFKKCNPTLSNVSLERLTGQMSQKSRHGACQRFTNASTKSGGILIATDVAARGLDFPDVTWIVQFEPPTDPAMLVHRIGRTARAGKEGETLILLTPHEEASVPFFRNRKINLLDIHQQNKMIGDIQKIEIFSALKFPEFNIEEDKEKALKEIPKYVHKEYDCSEGKLVTVTDDNRNFVWKCLRQFLLTDRDILLKATATFMSFIRAYKEHQLQYIFPMSVSELGCFDKNLQKLEIGEYASSLGLLRLPRLKEILGKKIESFEQSIFNPSLIVFAHLDKQKLHETKQKKLAETKKPKAVFDKENKETLKKTFISTEDLVRIHRTRSEKRRAKRIRVVKEWEDLACEERSAKKLRQGKISLHEYEIRVKNNDTDAIPTTEIVDSYKSRDEKCKWMFSGGRRKKKT